MIGTDELGVASLLAPNQLQRAVGADIMESTDDPVLAPGYEYRRLSGFDIPDDPAARRSEEHTSALQSLMRISYAVFCLKKKKTKYTRSISRYSLNTLHLIG